MCRIERMLYEANSEALESQSNFRLGAIISNKRYIIGRGHNSAKSHTKISTAKYSREHTLMHAEMAAVVAAETMVYGCDIFVCRIKRNGERAMARPCAMCLFLLRGQGINKAFYTIKRNEYGVIKL